MFGRVSRTLAEQAYIMNTLGLRHPEYDSAEFTYHGAKKAIHLWPVLRQFVHARNQDVPKSDRELVDEPAKRIESEITFQPKT